MFLSGCSTTDKNALTIDGSSPHATNQSLAAMQNALSTSERQEFILAILAINLSDVSGYEFLEEISKGNKNINFSRLGPKIDGLNYQQIMVLAEKSPTKVSWE